MQSSLALTSLIAATLAVWSCGGGYGDSSASTPTLPTATTPAPTPTPTPTPTPSPAPSPSQRTVTVSVRGSTGPNAFVPNPVVANSGDGVNFKNNDTTTHHIVLDDRSADLGEIIPGVTSQAVTLKSAAPVGFHCVVHPTMIGTINGVLTSAPPPDENPPYY